MTKQAVQTPNAPQAIGTYSQAIRAGSSLYLSGQVGLDPATMQLVEGVSQSPRGALVEIEAILSKS